MAEKGTVFVCDVTCPPEPMACTSAQFVQELQLFFINVGGDKANSCPCIGCWNWWRTELGGCSCTPVQVCRPLALHQQNIERHLHEKGFPQSAIDHLRCINKLLRGTSMRKAFPKVPLSSMPMTYLVLSWGSRLLWCFWIWCSCWWIERRVEPRIVCHRDCLLLSFLTGFWRRPQRMYFERTEKENRNGISTKTFLY